MKIGIDVGGSHIGLGIVNENGEIVYKKEKDYLFYEDDMSEVVIGTIILLIRDAIKENQITIDEIKDDSKSFPGIFDIK